MSTHIALFARRSFALLAAFFVVTLAAPAMAQMSGGQETRTFDVIADPDGANVHFATVWFGGGESVWRAESKVDAAELQKGVELVDQGVENLPSGLFTSYSSTTLTGNATYGDAHTFTRASDSAVDFMLRFKLETSCSVNCLLTALTFLMVDDLETDFENPGASVYALDYTPTFTGISGDYVEDHNPH